MKRSYLLYGILAILFLLVGQFQSWSVSLSILNLCLISAVMALGVNIQWGYGGLFNAGIMGFAAIGGATALLISHPPVTGAIAAGGSDMMLAFGALLVTIVLILSIEKVIPKQWVTPVRVIIAIVGFLTFFNYFGTARDAIEAFDPSSTGFLGGLGLPIILSWPVAAFTAALAAFLIGRVSLNLRSDYLAIATLGISEIVVSFVKNEDWLTRGVKNATGLPRPVPHEGYLQQQQWVIDLASWFNRESLAAISNGQELAALKIHVAEVTSIIIKLSYTGIFMLVLLLLILLSELSLNSPWGRMIRAIRDNEVAASAMGKNVSGRRMQILILGSAIVGIAGAMLVTYEGQFAPTSYLPLRYTFLIWVMVIVGGSGNNAGAVFGAFLIWFIWIEAEPIGYWLVENLTAWMDGSSPVRTQLLKQAQHFRLLIMGVILLLILRFNPGGLMPERPQKRAK